jgi:hypothetical protein
VSLSLNKILQKGLVVDFSSRALVYYVIMCKALGSNPSTKKKKKKIKCCRLEIWSKKLIMSGVIVHICNPSPKESKAGGAMILRLAWAM